MSTVLVVCLTSLTDPSILTNELECSVTAVTLGFVALFFSMTSYSFAPIGVASSSCESLTFKDFNPRLFDNILIVSI